MNRHWCLKLVLATAAACILIPVALILVWTFIVPIAAGLFILVLFVCRIIAFFSICGGKAKEPYIIRNFNFLR